MQKITNPVDIKFEFLGNEYHSRDSVPIIMSGLFFSPRSLKNDNVEAKCIVYDNDGIRYVAEFSVPHLQVLMNSDYSEYNKFLVDGIIPNRFFNASNLIDVVEVYTSYRDHVYEPEDYSDLSMYI